MNYPILAHYQTSLYPVWKPVGTAGLEWDTAPHKALTYLEMAGLCCYGPFGFARISEDDILSSSRRGAGDLAKNSHLFWKQVNAGKLPTWRSNMVLIVLHSIESSAHILNYIRQYNNSLQLVCLSSGRASQTSQRCRSLSLPLRCHLCGIPARVNQHSSLRPPSTLKPSSAGMRKVPVLTMLHV